MYFISHVNVYFQMQVISFLLADFKMSPAVILKFFYTFFANQLSFISFFFLSCKTTFLYFKNINTGAVCHTVISFLRVYTKIQ